jgi:hypothetical protein
MHRPNKRGSPYVADRLTYPPQAPSLAGGAWIR